MPLAVALVASAIAPSANGQSPAPSPSASPQPQVTPTPEPSPTNPAPTVTLSASRSPIVYGQSVKLSGRVEPAVNGTDVRIVDREGNEVASATPRTDGTYAVDIEPTRNLELRAIWLGAPSDPVPVKVRPLVKVSLRKVQLFGKAAIRGRVLPDAGGEMKLVLKRDGKTWRSWKVDPDGRFSKKVRITKLGRFKVRALYDPAGMKIGRTSTTIRRAALPGGLRLGSQGTTVKRLEWRLKSLGYYLPKVDGYYGVETHDAVIAFNKIQHRVRSGSVDSGTWRALASPRRPKPRHGGSHIEVDQTQQVVLVVRKGKVKWILHTSTGAGGASRDGTWTVHRKLEGYSPGRLYYPSYYDGLRAVHGWPDVPTYPASHGCARVPMWSATWIHGKMPHGSTVYVYH